MEYISGEEFLKQPKEVQQVFLNWWKPLIDSYDLVQHIRTGEITLVGEHQDFYESGYVLLLTEGQLREFIEDKTECFIAISPTYKCDGYDITILGIEEYTYTIKGTNLLQSYWEVACEIAKGLTI